MEMIQLGLNTSFKLRLFDLDRSPVYTSCEVLASTWSAAPASTFATAPERRTSQDREIQIQHLLLGLMHFCRLLEVSFSVPGRNFPEVLGDRSQWAPDEGFRRIIPTWPLANVIRLNWENNLHETKILFSHRGCFTSQHRSSGFCQHSCTL